MKLLAALLSATVSFTSMLAASLELDTTGGDVWSHRVDVTGRIDRHRCRSVVIEHTLGTTVATPLGERFHATVPLQFGANPIVAMCREGPQAELAWQVWQARLPSVPTARVRVRASGNTIVLDAGASELAPVLPAPIVRYQWRAIPGTDPFATADRAELAVPAVDGEYYVSLTVEDAAGRSDRSIGAFVVEDGRARDVDLAREHPSWVNDMVLYGAAPYSFTPATFDGVTDRLDEIAALGATAVWLSPVTEAAPDDFGYAVTDPFRVRAQFGTDRDLRALIDRAHGLGLRVLIDLVPNHLSEQSAYFRDAAEHGERSPYYRWFDRDAHGESTHYFDWTHLENLDYDHPQVRAYVTAAFARFVRGFDVDGFRVDASWAVAERAPEFFRELREELKRIDPDIALLAEASAREPLPFTNGFDAAYDWTARLGQWAWHDVFGDDGEVDLARLRAALTRSYPDDALVLRFLNNNDTGERFATRYGEPLARAAAALLFTVPGIPLVYNGDESGVAFEPYDERPLEWRDDGELARHYRSLANLRHTEPALRGRDLEMLHTNQDEWVLSYVRPATRDGKELLVLINFGTKPAKVRSADDRAHAVFKRFNRSIELMSGQPRRATEPLEIPPSGAIVLKSAV